MNIFRELGKLYSEIDSDFAIREFNSRSKGHHKQEQIWARKRKLNDHAYYLFMFTRLEDRIREQSSSLITKKQGSLSGWKQRSVWDNLPSDRNSTRLHFKKRVALLIENGTSDYAKIIDYYSLRNTLGHGGSFSTPVSMPNVINDFETLWRKLRA